MLSYVDTQSDDPRCPPRVLLDCQRLACLHTCPLVTREWPGMLTGPCSESVWIPARFLSAARAKEGPQVNRGKALKLFLRSLGLIK